jgi:nitrile hydratase beta subunit
MDSVHDLGGTDGMGSIEQEENEPYFHEEWEEEVFGLLPTTVGQGMYNLDEFRHGMERMDPAHYLSSSYYEHWLTAMETLLVEKGIINQEELQERLEEARSAEDPKTIVPEREDAELTENLLGLIEAGASAKRDPIEPAFESGDRVEVQNIHPENHTRCPEYVRQAIGEIEEVRGTFVYPDANAHGEGESPGPLYTVRFDPEELWGEEHTDGNGSRYVDLWESYLKEA